jgi:hypothetical protein
MTSVSPRNNSTSLRRALDLLGYILIIRVGLEISRSLGSSRAIATRGDS